MEPGLFLSALGAACFAVLFAVGLVLDRRPWRPGKPNYIPLMFVGIAGLMVFAARLISLLARG